MFLVKTVLSRRSRYRFVSPGSRAHIISYIQVTRRSLGDDSILIFIVSVNQSIRSASGKLITIIKHKYKSYLIKKTQKILLILLLDTAFWVQANFFPYSLPHKRNIGTAIRMSTITATKWPFSYMLISYTPSHSNIWYGSMFVKHGIVLLNIAM